MLEIVAHHRALQTQAIGHAQVSPRCSNSRVTDIIKGERRRMAAKALAANALSSCASEAMMAATEPAPKWRSSAARAAASEETPACA